MKKLCTKCQTSKPLTQFYRNRAQKDGLQHYCKACLSALARSKGASLSSTPKSRKPLPSAEPDVKETVSRIPERYQIVRRTSRCTGQCSWGIYDDVNQAEIFVGDCLHDVLNEKERLDAPPQKWSYRCRTGQTGVIVND